MSDDDEATVGDATAAAEGGQPAGSPLPATAPGAPASWQRPPFAKGHGAAIKSGAQSPRVYGELAELLLAGLLDSRPDLAAYPEAVAAWATAEAQAALMRRDLHERGSFGEDGEPRRGPLNYLHTFENAAAKRRRELGLDPMSEAKLAKERAEAAGLASDLSALAQRGAAALAERGGPVHPDLAGQVLHGAVEQAKRVQAESDARWRAGGSEHHEDDDERTTT